MTVPAAPMEDTAAFLSRLAQATQPLGDPTQVMQTTAKLVSEYLNADRCAYASVEDEEIFVIAGDHSRNGARSIVGRWPVAAFGAECARQLRAAEAFVVNDAENDSRIRKEDLQAYDASEIRAVICVPLHKAGTFTAAMAVHQKVARVWSASEVALVTQVVARCWEVLERANTEARYRGRLDYAVRLSGIGFWYCNLPFDELIWDERVKEHFFLPKDARVTIDLFYQQIHPADRAATKSAIDCSIANHTSYDVVYRTLDAKTGAMKWIRALGGAAYGVDGNPVHFDGVTVDVTTQQLAQERIAEYARLQSNVARAALQVHASSSPDSVLRVVTEEARIIIGASRAWSRYQAPGWPQAIEVISDHGAPVDGNAPMLSVPFHARDGTLRGSLTLEHKLVGPFSQMDQSVLTQLVGIAVVALENAILYDELREQDRKKDEFLAVLAHELRNPLAPIRTGLSVLQLTKDPQISANTQSMMERQVVHLVRLVDDLLDVSRITRGKVTLKKERLEAKSVIESAIEASRPALDEKQQTLSLKLPPESLWLDADPIRIAQVIANLLNNAIKFSPPGAAIRLDVDAEGGMLCLRLRDQGKGISALNLPRIFDMFAQTSEDNGPGLGIGLALALRFVEMHDGTIQVDSPGVGLGSVFTVRLPLATQAASKANVEDPARLQAGFRVLVVDDNVDAAVALSSILELSGHLTRLVHTGLEVLEAAVEFKPDIVLLDIGLPGLDGYQVARQLRQEPALDQTRLVALTGWGSLDDKRRSSDAGFDAHLVKPVDTKHLKRVLNEVTART